MGAQAAHARGAGGAPGRAGHRQLQGADHLHTTVWSAPLELVMPCSARRATSSSCMGRLGAAFGSANSAPIRSACAKMPVALVLRQ